MNSSGPQYHCFDERTSHQFDAAVRFAAKLTWASQDKLRVIENPLAKMYHVSVVTGHSPSLLHFLNLTSLPYIKFGKPIPNLRDMWEPPVNRADLVWRPTFGTGNLAPKYVFLGDAPGVGDGVLKLDNFDRVFVYGVSSHLLRKALILLDVYYKSYFTNFLKLATPRNIPSTEPQRQAHHYLLATELEQLRPKVIVLLGNHVASAAGSVDEIQAVRTVKVYHPSYAVRMNWTPREYAEHIASNLL